MKTFELIDTQIVSKLRQEWNKIAFEKLRRNKGHHSSSKSQANYSQKVGLSHGSLWGIDIPRVLKNTKTYRGPPDGPPTGSSYGTGQRDIAGLGKPDPRRQRPTLELGATETLIPRELQLQLASS
jgi:hypothetical protein